MQTLLFLIDGNENFIRYMTQIKGICNVSRFTMNKLKLRNDNASSRKTYVDDVSVKVSRAFYSAEKSREIWLNRT